MRREKVLTLIGSLCLILVLAVLPFVTACSAPTEEPTTPTEPTEPEEPPAPDVVEIMTYDLGASAYVMYGYLGEAMFDTCGTRLRCIPAGTDVARLIPVRSGDAPFAGHGSDIYYAVEGLGTYASPSWGPQPLRIVWTGQQPGTAAAVRADSGMKTCADLKGKRLAWIPGSVFNMHNLGHLRFGNLTWDDVEKVQISSYGAMLQAVIDGKIDMAICCVTAPPMYELAGSPHGLNYLSLPPDDKAAWARMNEVIPYLSPYRATYGAGLSEEHPAQIEACPHPVTLCYDFLDDDMAYFMTKAINECYPLMAERSETMKRFWSLETCLDTYEHNRGLIFHPGSIRYLKEIGMWEPRYDEIQQKRLERQKGLKELWDKTLNEAEEQEIKAADYPDFWLAKRSEAFPSLGD